MASPRDPFPTDPDRFQHDDRIAWSNADKTYILQDENGEEWEWKDSVRKWSSLSDVDADAEEAYKAAYKTTGEDNAVAFDFKKRQAERYEKIAAQKKQEEEAKQKPAENTAVFVSGLPATVDRRDLELTFGKYGMINESVESNKKRVVMYYDDDGNFKGEALIVYFRPESVNMAIMMADETDFETGASGGSMRVQAASDSYKEHKGSASTQSRATTQGKGAKGTNNRAAQKMEEMKRRLADWSDDEDAAEIRPQDPNAGKVVIITRAFSLKELDDAEDRETEKHEIAEDIESQAELHGKVVEVIVYDREAEGVVTVQFEEAEAAEKCAAKFKGRVFDGRRLNAWVRDGQERYAQTTKPKPKKQRLPRDDPDDEERRLEEYGNFIEGKGS